MDVVEIISAVAVFLTAPWVWLILFASVLYAAGNYIDELLLSNFEQEVGTLVIISTLFGLLVALVFLTVAWFTGASVVLDSNLVFKALLIGFLEAMWVIPYLYATERSGAIIAGPLFQAVPVFALGFESFLGTIPPAMQLLGALIIVVGGIVISIERDEDEEGNTSHKVDWVTIGMMSLSAVLVALIYVLFRDTAVATSFLATGFWVGIGTFLTGIALYCFWQPYRRDFNAFCANTNYKAVAVQFGNEVLDAGGVYMTHLATTLGPSVMVVTAFNATQPIAVGIIGAFLTYFGYAGISSERAQGAWILVGIGIVCIAGGIVVLALGSPTA